MAWPNPFRHRDKNTRTAWGYTFQLTSDHLTPEQIAPMKQSFDELGGEALERLDAISQAPQSLLPRTTSAGFEERSRGKCGKNSPGKEDSSTAPKRDLYITLRDNAQDDPVLGQLWTEAHTVPSWVNWDQVARGQDVFYRYGGPVLIGLAFQSLLGGMGGFSATVARHRLFETTQFLLQVTQSLQSLQPGGAGHASAVRVRLLHAAVRRKIMKLAQERPDYYDVHSLGVPINDLDCIATIGTFSATLIWLSLPRQGIFLTQQEAADYTHLFRYVAYLMGTPTEFFETPEKSKMIMEVLFLYEVNPSETSKILANNVVQSLVAQPPSYASRPYLEANSRWLNGNDLCDALGLGKPSLYYWALAAGQCLFFMAVCYFYRSIPYLDRRKIKLVRRVFWAIIIENKGGLGEETIFEFKYVPELSKKTRKEDPVDTGLKQPVIGTTTDSGNGFDSVPQLNTYAVCAGSAVIVARVDEELNIIQRFYRAGPSAATVNPSTSFYSPPTPNILGESSKGTLFRHGNYGTGSPAAIGDASTVSPGRSRASARTRSASCVSLSADGQLLAIGETGYNPRINIFSIAEDGSDVPLTVLHEHSFGLISLAFSPDTRWLCSLGDVNDGFVFLWSVSKHGAARLHSSNKCISTVHAIAWMGNSVISVGIRHVKVWRLEHVLPASPTKMRTDMSRLHDGSSGSPAPKTFSGRNCLLGSLLDATFTCVAALSDLEAILCTERGDICLLDDTDKKQRLERVAIAPFKVFCISVHKENGTVFLGGKDGKTQELPIQSLVPGASPGSNNESPSPISPTSGGPESCSDILAVGFLRDHIVSVDASHQITIRRPRTFDFSPFSDTDAKLITAHESAVRGVNTLSQPNPQEADFMTWSSQGTVLFWTLDGVCKDKLAVSLEQSPSGPHGTMNELKLLRASSDTFIFGDRYGNIGLVKKPLDALRAHNGEVNDLALARKTDGVVLVASCGRDRTLQLFQLTGDSLEISQTMENEHAASVNSLMFVNKGAMLISGSADRTIIIRTMAIGSSRIAALSPTRVISLKSSPTSFTTMADDSDTLIVSTMDRQIHNFDLRTGSLMHTFKATDSAKIESVIMTSITVVHLHSEAYHVPIVFGVSSTDKSIRAYDNETGVMLAREYGQLVVSDIAYLQRTLADGCVSHHAISTGLDGTVIIWDLSQQANHQVGLDGTVSCGTTLSESSMSIKPLRKILSRSELLGFQNPSDAPQDPCTPTRSNHSSRVRKKTSRLTLASTPKQNALMRAKSTQHSPTPSVSEAKDLEGSRHPSATKPPKKESAAFRAKRSSNASPRYQIGTKCSDNLVSLSEKVCQTLREYRGHISASSRSLNSVQAEQVERELTLTIHAVKATTRRSDEQASGGANEDGSIDGWLAKMIDERLALRLERAASDDGKKTFDGGVQN